MTKFPLKIFNLPLWQIWSKKIMSRMANVLKRASRQAKKQLYQSVGETEGTLKGKPRRKKQVSKASVVPGIPEGETIDTLEEQKQQQQERITRPQYSSYADGYHFSFQETRCII